MYNWKLFLDFAEKLLDDRSYDDITRARVALSRAYYACFNVAKDVADSLRLDGTNTGGGGVHRDVYYKYVSSKNVPDDLKEDSASLGNRLNSLRSLRTEADYECESSNMTLNTARMNVQIAKILYQQFWDFGEKVRVARRK